MGTRGISTVKHEEHNRHGGDAGRDRAAEASAPSRPAAPGRAGRWVVLATVVAMTFMSTLDSSIVNVALPAMQRELAAGAADIQWVSSVYLLTCCVTVLVFGRLGDLVGKTRLFQAGVALFTAGSALCALSQTLPVLVAARIVQGLGASCATANNMGIVTEAFPASQRGRALGVVSTFVSLGMMCGPTIGGVLVASFPWESIFVINVPVGIAAFAVGCRTLPRDRARGTLAGFDALGAVLLAAAVLCTFLSLTWLAQGATPVLVALLVAGLSLAAVFVVHERRTPAPLVVLGVFRNAEFTCNVAAMLICFIAVGGTEYLLPFYLQDACGLPSDVAGLALTAIPAAMAVAGPVAGALSDRIGSFWPCLVGLVLYGAGIAYVGTLDEHAALALIVVAMAVMAAGTGLFQSPNNSLVMGAVDTANLGFAGSLASLVRYMGMSAGVTGGTTLLYGCMSAAAGHRVDAYVAGRPDLFLHGFFVTFAVFGVACLAGAVLLVLGRRLRCRARAGRTA